MNFGIESVFSKDPGSTFSESLGPLYEVCPQDLSQNCLSVICDVPKGSLLGPFFFLIKEMIYLKCETC